MTCNIWNFYIVAALGYLRTRGFNSVFGSIYIMTTLLYCKVKYFQNWYLERKPSQFYGTIMEQPKVTYRDHILRIFGIDVMLKVV